MIERLDSFLIDKVFQPAGDKLTEWTHRTCFWFAAQIICIALVLCACHVALLWYDAVEREATRPWLSLLISPVWGLIWYRLYREAARRDEAVAVSPCGNPNRLRHMTTRAWLVGLLVLGSLMSATDALFQPFDLRSVAMRVGVVEWAAYVSALYWLSCEGRTPRTRRAFAWAGAGA